MCFSSLQTYLPEVIHPIKMLEYLPPGLPDAVGLGRHPGLLFFMSSSGDSSMYNNTRAIALNDIDKEALFPSLLCPPLKKCTVEAEITDRNSNR